MEGFKPFGWYLTLVQFGFYSMFGLVELQLTQDKRRRYDNRLCFYPQKTAFTVKHILCLTFSPLFFLIFFLFHLLQDTREDLYDYSIFNGGHYGPVKYLFGLLELPYTGHLQVL